MGLTRATANDSHRAHVCLITPRHLYANPRLVKEAVALSEAGYVVSILAGRYAPDAVAYDDAIADPAWSLRYVKFGPFEADRLSYLRQTAKRHAARALARMGNRSTGVLQAAHSSSTPLLMEAAVSIRAQLYIAHYTAALPAAALAARVHGGAFAYDAEDFHIGEFPDAPQHEFEKGVIRDIERTYVADAAYVSAAAPLIADAYASTYGIPTPRVILNCFPRANAPSRPSQSGVAEPGPSLYWFSQTIGPGRGLECAVAALSRMRSNTHLYLRGAPSPGYDAHLRGIASGAGVGGRLHFLPPAPPADLERLGSAYDIGYIGEICETRNRQIAITNKLFSYMCSGLPIVATDIEAHVQLAPGLSGALSLFAGEQPDDLARSVDDLVLDPGRLAGARQRSWSLAQDRYCWEIEQQEFLDAVGDAIAESRVSA